MNDDRFCAIVDCHLSISRHCKKRSRKGTRIVNSCDLVGSNRIKNELTCHNERCIKRESSEHYKTEFEMTEELIQRGLVDNPERMKEWCYYNIGSTTVSQLACAGIIPKRDYSILTKRNQTLSSPMGTLLLR